MNVSYRGLSLSIVHTRSILRTAIETSDNSTFLFARWLVDVDCIYNPAATSFNPDPTVNVIGTSGVAQAGNFPPVTDSSIRQTLMQPQGVLILTDEDGRLILRSPAPGFAVDAKTGPGEIECQVQHIHGTKTWQVHFKIVTYVNECQKQPGTSTTSRAILLSHRWRRYVDIDEDHFSVVVHEGRCIFRADELVRLGEFPDQFRQQLFHAIPANFRRSAIHVAPSEDGTTVEYRVVDTEMAFNFLDPSLANGTRVEAVQTGVYAEPNRLAERAATVALQLGAASLDFAHAGGNAARIEAQGALRLLPSYSMHVICRVWGNRNSSRFDLMRTALGVCTARIGPAGNFLGITGRSSETIVMQELTGKFVEAQITIRWGPEQITVAAANFASSPLVLASVPSLGIINAVLNAFNAPTPGTAPPGIANPTGPGAIISFFPNNETISIPQAAVAVGPPAPPAVAISQNAAVATYPPPNSGGTRGTWVGQLVAQALSAPCSLPPRPPLGGLQAPPNINTVTVDLPLYPAGGPMLP